MTARALMIQGTGSDVGKSTLVAGLCRAFHRRGLRVRPFKPQNMSNNAAVATEGGEIGRAQALQARAAGAAPSVHMNPVLLKPESDRRAQVIVQGRVAGHLDARDFLTRRRPLLEPVLESFDILRREADLVLVEGAGSPAEVNLRAGDIANMGFARASGTPVILVGDIDRGGVIASLVGTHAVLDAEDRALVRGFLINKFRGDPLLFDAGLSFIRERTGWVPLGVVPWLAAARRLPAEDAVVLDRAPPSQGQVLIAVPMLSRIANFDDLDPLAAEPDVELRMIAPGTPLPAGADLVILPGTKSTRADMAFLQTQGWDIDLKAHVRRGGRVLGLCGGYQLLGREVHDPLGLDGAPGSSAGLGLLDVATVMAETKTQATVTGTSADGARISAYEIHCGVTSGPDTTRPFLTLDGAALGARTADGRVEGCYLHGLFASDAFRDAYLARLSPGARARRAYEAGVEEALDDIAETLGRTVDLDHLLALAG